MVRKLTVVIGVAMSLVVARDASPDTITPTNLDTWTGDRFFLRSHTDSFRVPIRPLWLASLPPAYSSTAPENTPMCSE